MAKKTRHKSTSDRVHPARHDQGCLEIPLPGAENTDTAVEGDPDLRATRLLCLGIVLPFALFALWLPFAATGAADRLDSGNMPLVGLLIIMLVLAAVALVVIVARAGFTDGAWARVDEKGFGYGKGASSGMRPVKHFSWSRIDRNPAKSHDISIATTLRSEALNPRLAFWYRAADGTLSEQFLPLRLSDDIFRCLRFHNGHALRVALLQGLARKGLRFHPEVFVEAGIDPESWRPHGSTRRLQWLVPIAIVASIFLTVQADWPMARIVSWVVANFALGVWALMAHARSHPRLSRIIVFTSAQP